MDLATSAALIGLYFDGIRNDKTNIEDTIMNFIFKIDEEKAIFLERVHKILLKDSILNEEIRKYSRSLN